MWQGKAATMKSVANKFANRVQQFTAQRSRGASVDVPEAPRLGSVLGRPCRPVAAARVTQPRARAGEAPSLGGAIIGMKAAIADAETSNNDFLEAVEQAAAAVETCVHSGGANSGELDMLGDMRKQLATAQQQGPRVVRFNASELARYQTALRQLGAADLATQAGRLRLDHYVMRPGADAEPVVDGARLDASAKEWLAAIEAGHAAGMPTQCRLVGELEGFKRDLLDGVACNWHDFIKIVCMIPGMLDQLRNRNTWSIQLHRNILDRVANPPAPAKVVDEVLREITKFQVKAAQCQLDGNEKSLNFKFVSTRESRYETQDGRLGSPYQRVEASGDDPTYRVVATGFNEIAVHLLNAQVDSVLDDGCITYSADVWRYTAPGEEPAELAVQQPRPAPEMKLMPIEVALAGAGADGPPPELSGTAQALADATSVIEETRPTIGRARRITHEDIVQALESAAQSYSRLRSSGADVPKDVSDALGELRATLAHDMNSRTNWAGTMTNKKPEWNRFLAALDLLECADVRAQAEELAAPRK
jgi:hypothetical protein